MQALHVSLSLSSRCACLQASDTPVLRSLCSVRCCRCYATAIHAHTRLAFQLACVVPLLGCLAAPLLALREKEGDRAREAIIHVQLYSIHTYIYTYRICLYRHTYSIGLHYTTTIYIHSLYSGSRESAVSIECPSFPVAPLRVAAFFENP